MKKATENKPAPYVPLLMSVALHVEALADDAYLAGHPEWLEIVKEAKYAIEKSGFTK